MSRPSFRRYKRGQIERNTRAVLCGGGGNIADGSIDDNETCDSVLPDFVVPDGVYCDLRCLRDVDEL